MIFLRFFLSLWILLLATPAAAQCTGECENGVGEYRYSNGHIYEGEFIDGKRHGQGKYTWPDGQVYEGAWSDHKRNGRGIMTYASGTVYEGNWVGGERQGRGTDTYVNGDVYMGNWVGGKRMGIGTYTWVDGRTFVGEWEDGHRSGIGKWTHPDGTTFEGQYVEDKRNGRGTLTRANGTTQTGLWRDNSLVMETDFSTPAPVVPTAQPSAQPSSVPADAQKTQSAWIIATGAFFVIFFVAANLLMGKRAEGFATKLMLATLASLGSGCVLFLIGISAGVNLVAIPIIGGLTLVLAVMAG